MTTRWPWVVLVVPALLAQDPVTTLIRRGNAAFDEGDAALACTYYERAQRRATDPGLVAFNLATAKYHLAREGDPQALAEAEVAYRSCLGPNDPRRAAALFGLGNCLLLRGGTGRLDSLALRAAIDRYTECLRQPDISPRLAGDARHNQERARLLLLQALPSTGSGEPESGDEGTEKPKDSTPDPSPSQPEERPAPGAEQDGQPGPGKGTPREQEGQPGGKPVAGRGTLPPLPDQADAPPLSRPDALEHLDGAWRRIRDDWLSHRRGRARPAVSGVRDW